MPKPISKRPSAIQVSIVTPAFNESQNLPLLYHRLKRSFSRVPLRWEWIVVDDHSTDSTYQVMDSIARRDKRVKVLRFAKNSGSHLALACALKEAKGKCAVGMAADLQDPPETIPELYAKWMAGAKVVWAVRDEREGEGFLTVFFARLYYFIVRYGVGLKQLPPTGADFFLLDRVVLKRLAQSQVRNASILLLICSFDYRQEFITYTKRKRVHGKSGWSLRKKLKLFFDSITMFSRAPLYWVMAAGMVFGLSGGWIVSARPMGTAVWWEGYFPMVLGCLLVGTGVSILKSLDETSPEPLFTVEKRSDR